MLLKRTEVWQASKLHTKTVSTARNREFEESRQTPEETKQEMKQQEVCGENWFSDTHSQIQQSGFLKPTSALTSLKRPFFRGEKKKKEVFTDQFFTSLDQKYS